MSQDVVQHDPRRAPSIFSFIELRLRTPLSVCSIRRFLKRRSTNRHRPESSGADSFSASLQPIQLADKAATWSKTLFRSGFRVSSMHTIDGGDRQPIGHQWFRYAASISCLFRSACLSSSVITLNRANWAGPKAVEIATSAASRAFAITIRPIRG